MVPRVIAIDWSGANGRAERSIWLAEVEAGQVARLESGRDRRAIAEHLIHNANKDPQVVVGLDFAFSFPAWYLHERGLKDAPDLWELAELEGERWLTECASPFWGRPGVTRPELTAHFRQTELDTPAVKGTRPKSVFQIGGAGAVGTGSIRGMPVLRRLREAGFAVWPFDPPQLPLAIEIYPRALTGAVQKSSPDGRRLYMAARCQPLPEWALERATHSEDAFDALISALVMAQYVDDFASLPTANAGNYRLEGRIWAPSGYDPKPTPSRRSRDSSKTRVGPVFRALQGVGMESGSWVAKMLDLASDPKADRPWHRQDLRLLEHYWEPNERSLLPPVSLLSWLIRNLGDLSPTLGRR